MAKEIDQPQSLSVEASKEVPKPRDKKVGKSLYDINEIEGGFEVVLPGLFDKKRELIVGITREHFLTREEAEQAIEKSREAERILFERASLEKTFSKNFFRIDETKDGKFRVVLPGLVNSKTGYYVGTSYKEFDSWDQAKEYFLQTRENQERLTQKPLLEVQTGENERIAFSGLDAFDPRVAPSEQPHEIPASIQKYLMGGGRLDGNVPSASTYRETIKEEGWEKRLFSFFQDILNEEGTDTAKELGIEHLDALTPKQAIEVATRIVIDLTKYKWSDTKEEKSDISPRSEKTGADKKTVQQLLQEGFNRKNDPGWEGNGICRNFASSVKAVFEALKANQTRFSQLRDMYCLYESGTDEFAPKRQKKNVTEVERTGHAWNTFVTVSREGAANATIIDVTWAKRNLDTKQIEGLDYTLTRMEPVVHAVGQNLSETTPNKKDQLGHLLSYYVLKIEGSNQTPSEVPPIDKLDEKEKAYFRDTAVKNFGEKYDLTNVGEDQLIALGQTVIVEIRKWQEQERERQFFTTRAVALMTRQGMPKELPKALTEAISREYQTMADDADRTEIETIYKISQNNSGVDFRAIFKSYLKDKQLSNYHADALMFTDNNLQRAAFEEIKFHKDYEKFVKESPKFRARMREVIPQLFLDFSPGTKPEDATELKYLIGRSRMLSRYESLIDPRNPSEGKINGFFERARQSLRVVNPQRYDEVVANLDDYQLVKQYDILERELRV